jgi:hypothetical protein
MILYLRPQLTKESFAMRKFALYVAGLVFFVSLFSHTNYPQTTVFTYQGVLSATGDPANGDHDFEFALFDAVAAGTQLGSTQTLNNVPVSAGVFSVQLDFGNNFPGANRFIEVRVRPSGAGGFTTLSPRQAITSAPYSVRSLSTESAANADTAVNATNAQQLNGISANQYVLTNDSRMFDARNPLPGSASYIQNTNSPQAASNFNISGKGSADTFNAAAGYEINGSRILSNAGTNNLFAGVSSGAVNTSGVANAFFGTFAGQGNTTGGTNSFFGSSAGFSNTIGNENAFFGTSAGSQNTTGNFNTFAGSFAGFSNISGFSNSFFGRNAGMANTTAASNAFFGANAGADNTTGGTNSFFGSSAGANNVTGGNNSFFGASSGSTGTAASNNSFFGRNAGLNAAGDDNSFFGNSSGLATTTGTNNTFLGASTGSINTVGTRNTLVGFASNVGSNNLSFATAIGAGAIAATSNSITLGRSAGQDAVQIPGNLSVTGTFNANGSALTNLNASNVTTGILNPARLGNGAILNSNNEQASANFNISGNGTVRGTLFGTTVDSGFGYNINGLRILGTSPGASNLFAGFFAGATATGSNNAFFGSAAGADATTAGSNSFFGSNAGNSTTTGFGNSFFGTFAGLSNLSGQSNSFFGNSSGGSNTASENSFFGAFSGQSNTTGTENAFFGANAGSANGTASNNSFFGADSGLANTTGASNSFFGTGSGAGNLNGVDNAFFGVNTGRGNTSGNRNTFYGRLAGRFGTTGSDNTAIGYGAGDNITTGSNLTLVGANANVGSGALTFATAVGAGAIVSVSNSVVLGRAADTVSTQGKFVVGTLGNAGPTALCRNASNEISTCSSSIRYKEQIEPFTGGLRLLGRLRPVSFNWRDGGMRDVGLVAEEVDAVEPLLTTTNAEGSVEGVKYDRIGVVLINAVKEQQAQIEVLRQQVELLTHLLCKTDPESEACRK